MFVRRFTQLLQLCIEAVNLTLLSAERGLLIRLTLNQLLLLHAPLGELLLRAAVLFEHLLQRFKLRGDRCQRV